MPRSYVYEVARVRMREFSLLSEYDKSCLISCSSVEECLDFLANSKGWGYSCRYIDHDVILRDELSKSWDFILELVRDKKMFSALLCRNDYENLKVSIKSIMSNLEREPLFVSSGLVSVNTIYEGAKKKNFEKLPDYMRYDAEKAMSVLLKTGDAMYFDIILDKSLVKAMNLFAKESDCELIDYYVKTITACSNIKIILRCIDLKKDAKFIRGACLPCKDLDVDKLIMVAAKGKTEFCDYLRFTDYSDGVVPLLKSLTSFEKWCDDRICEKSRSERIDPFSITPLVAYIFAKMNEVRVARIIMSSKINNISDNFLEERVGKMYA